MSETSAPYAVTGSDGSQWLDVRFDNGEHTGVRILRGTTIIEVQRNGRRKLMDIADCKPLDAHDMIVST